MDFDQHRNFFRLGLINGVCIDQFFTLDSAIGLQKTAERG